MPHIGKNNAKDLQKKGVAKRKENAAKRGKAWDLLGEEISNEWADKVRQEITGLKGKDFLDYYMKILEHFKPKLARIDGVQTENNIFNILPKDLSKKKK